MGTDAPTRRRFFETTGAAVAGVAATAAGAFGTDRSGNSERTSRVKAKRTGPNLVFILADQLRYASCGYAGDAKARTPNIDRLASQGVGFCNAVSSTPVCAPFRASLMTGKYTTSTGMVINELRLSPEHECIGHVLTRAGYQAGYIGKWHLWANQLGHHRHPQNGFVPPGPYRLGFDGYWAGYNFNHRYYKAYYFEDTNARIDVDGYEPDVQTDLAIRFINRAAKRDAPFALFLSYGTPHDPWVQDNVPKRFADPFRDVVFPKPPNYKPHNDPYADSWGRFKPTERKYLEQWMRIYYAQTASMDWNIGRLVKALDAAGAADDTILVFTSDHGEMFGAHGRRAKNIFYDEACRIPFLIRWRGGIKPQTVSDACLTTPDMMPTLLGLMGLEIPKAVEGMDLSHRALGRPGPEPDAALLQNTGACAAWSDGYEWRALRDKRFTYAVYRVDGKELLFDHIEDPYQMTDLIGQPAHAETAARFRTMLKRRMAELKDTFPPSTWYRDRWTKDRVILRGAKGGAHDLARMNDILRAHWGDEARRVGPS